MDFLLTNCLMPSDKDKSTTAKAMGLVFFTVQCYFVPKHAFWYTAICTIHASLTYLCSPLCPFLFADSSWSIRGSMMASLRLLTGIVCISVVIGLIAEVLLLLLFVCL